jgi:hypothetical protein
MKTKKAVSAYTTYLELNWKDYETASSLNNNNEMRKNSYSQIFLINFG